jgi:hypothetical protein
MNYNLKNKICMFYSLRSTDMNTGHWHVATDDNFKKLHDLMESYVLVSDNDTPILRNVYASMFRVVYVFCCALWQVYWYKRYVYKVVFLNPILYKNYLYYLGKPAVSFFKLVNLKFQTGSLIICFRWKWFFIFLSDQQCWIFGAFSSKNVKNCIVLNFFWNVIWHMFLLWSSGANLVY